jgi:DNA-binding response OmpR family regulator
VHHDRRRIIQTEDESRINSPVAIIVGLRILVVEDEPRMGRLLGKVLRESGFAVDVVGSGEAALEQIDVGTCDLIVLDILLPGRDGLSVCREIRERGFTAPILIISALGETADRVRGLELGADDYLPKPFAIEELRARVSALLRRRSHPPEEMLTVGNLRLNRWKRLVTVDDHHVELTGKEYALLEFLLLNSGRLVTREEIAEHVWDVNFDPFSNLIEVYIGRLRQKIDRRRDSEESFVTTRRGEGYLVDLREVGS